ncbi:hypothetical protein H9Q70_004644 [Fusarium xylarioides]|nr:hypothetical protein H9Q70_004644 [Fusarium xylarioides]KAG5779144.1 hypothetical protein H9Q73_007177 [Fusarium xylarioides]
MLKNEGNKMVHDAPGSEPVSPQRGPPNAPPSKKPSAYVFDSNGDTQIILSTSIAQTFKWEADKIWIEEEKRKKAYLRRNKWEKKKGKTVEFSPPTTPQAPQESSMRTSTSLGGNPNAPPIDWGKVDFSDFWSASDSPEISDGHETDLGHTDPGTNPDTTSFQTQDWEYGETCAPHLKKIDF